MPRPVKRFPRYLAPRLREALRDTPAVLIHGPRQSGKTTLARVVGEPRGYRYVPFDDEAVRRAATADPIGFVNGLPPKSILDEALKLSMGEKARKSKRACKKNSCADRSSTAAV